MRFAGDKTDATIPPAGSGRRRARWLLAACRLGLTLVLLNRTAIVPAQEVEVLLPAKEAQVKCAFLYSFGLMVNWPNAAFPAADSPFVIGVLGERSHSELLDRLAATKKIRGRNILIRRYSKVEEIDACHILFVTAGVAPAQEQAAQQRIGKRPVLIVGERPLDGGQAASPVHFVIENQVVKFRIDLDAAKARQLQIDPRLLKLAATAVPSSQP